jgi:uncharacterized protein (DUF1697 family)
MTAYVALLRAINVGGRNLVSMDDLRALVTGLGFAHVRTLLQSGNLVFEGRGGPIAALEARLERETKQRLSVDVDYMVRTADEWRAIVDGNPFEREAVSDPGHLVVLSTKQPVPVAAVRALQKAIVGREVVRGAGHHLYAIYPDGQGRSKLTNALIEKALGTRVTARNWNTVRKLAAMLR